jgi:hypothetical protein
MYLRGPSGPLGETNTCGCMWIIVPASLSGAVAKEEGLRHATQALFALH